MDEATPQQTEQPPTGPTLQLPGTSSPSIIEPLAVFVIGTVLMCIIYGSHPGVPGQDSYYHIKMAMLMPEVGIIHDFPWLRFVYFTDQGQEFVNHHYGFHALLTPFVYLSKWLTGDFVPGARWAMALLFGLSLMLFDRLLSEAKVRWRWLWLVFFVLMPLQFFSRHAYVRAISPSLVCMLLLTLLMFRRRYIASGVVVACYIHLYLGGVMYGPLLVCLYFIASLISLSPDRGDLKKLLGWTIAGWIVGIATHPYAGGMWDFLRLQVFGSGLSPDISVGREWQPYEGVWWFARLCGTVLVIWTVAVMLRLRVGKPLSRQGLMLLLSHVVLLTLTLKARRFIEYWPVFCLLSAAYLSAPAMGRIVDWFERPLRSATRLQRDWTRRIGAGLLVLSLFAIVEFSPPWKMVRENARCAFDIDAIGDAMAYLKEHSEPGDVVFTDDWDIFPALFYHNTHNHYIVGMDPKFTQARRPELWERYVKITRGLTPTNAAVKTGSETGNEETKEIRVELEDIREHFQARFVITDRDHRRLAKKLLAREDFAERVYPPGESAGNANAPYLIFKIDAP